MTGDETVDLVLHYMLCALVTQEAYQQGINIDVIPAPVDYEGDPDGDTPQVTIQNAVQWARRYGKGNVDSAVTILNKQYQRTVNRRPRYESNTLLSWCHRYSYERRRSVWYPEYYHTLKQRSY